jgi:hypothetical protein
LWNRQSPYLQSLQDFPPPHHHHCLADARESFTLWQLTNLCYQKRESLLL